MSDPTPGTRVAFGRHAYEWDGADWFCPSNTHGPANIDEALTRLAQLEAAIVRHFDAAEAMNDIAEELDSEADLWGLVGLISGWRPS